MPIVGHGIDMVDIERISALLDDHAQRFLDRCFTPDEQRVGMNANATRGRRYAEHLAARFAAKEAALKALGTGLADGIQWTDVEVVKDPRDRGAPTLRLHNAALEVAQRLGVTRSHLSLSHTDSAAIASVILESDMAPSGNT